MGRFTVVAEVMGRAVGRVDGAPLVGPVAVVWGFKCNHSAPLGGKGCEQPCRMGPGREADKRCPSSISCIDIIYVKDE